MIDKVFLILAILYLNVYGTNHFFNLTINFYNFYTDLFTYYNKIIYSDYWDDEKIVQDKIEITNKEDKLEPKYEDKYLEDIRKLNKEWKFTNDENNEFVYLLEKYYNASILSGLTKIDEITKKISYLEKEINEDNDYVVNLDEERDSKLDENTLEERNYERRLEIESLQYEANNINIKLNTENGLSELKNNAIISAKQDIIDRKLDKLKNSYVIEKTPIGNVLMIYEKDKESFKYYSDSNIPYRYLEVVARKYVKLFDCRPIFIDMEEELRLFEEKWEKEQELKKLQEEKDKKNTKEKLENSSEKKKNIFAKFKSYNKDAGGKISMAVPPKNNIPKSVIENKENEKILLKERANRYTYEGKFANFNFLQKIDRKIFNKKLGISFSDFKKMKK